MCITAAIGRTIHLVYRLTQQTLVGTVTGVALVAMVCVERRGEGEAATVLPGCMTVPSGGRTVWEVTADCAVLVGIAWVTVEEASLAFFGQPLVEPFLFPF